ncbi:MAG: hypothetical protein E6Q67_05140 [Roseateles sp.]|nr:MAG: hypothetical protein E6Q67_05140 [Roseateles sp.]
MAGCECTSRCGDDPEVTAGRVLGCQTYRMRRSPDHLGCQVEMLQRQLKAVVSLMDRMEPHVEEPDRASDEEWDKVKADAIQVLKTTEAL